MRKQGKSKIAKLNKNIMTLKNTKGITLIALVITIIVLIILASVSMAVVFNQDGIIAKARQAKSDYANAQNEEATTIGNLISKIDEAENENNNPPKEVNTVAEAKGGNYFDKATTLEDSNGNKIKVPQGFKIAEDSGINVTEGIVIEDNDIIEGIGNNRGNQYVWIPVGTGIKKADGSSVDITLGRYVFADGENHKDSSGNVLAKGTPILKQNAENYTDEIEINKNDIEPKTIDNYNFKELATSRTGVASNSTDGLNTTALNLKGFVDSVKTNGGYYIARYEASYGTDGKANSKVSNSFAEDTAPTTEGALWNNITQINAATASRGLYTTVTTDLINSYAWDTAIVYIQNFSGDTDYSKQDGPSINSSLTNTGANRDEVCKINDMASNTREWTTEYSTLTNSSYAYPCTSMGGYYGSSDYYTSYRGYDNATISYEYNTFRTTLYM